MRKPKDNGPNGYDYYYGTVEYEVPVSGSISDPDYGYDGSYWRGFFCEGSEHGFGVYVDSEGKCFDKAYCLTTPPFSHEISPEPPEPPQNSIRVVLPSFESEPPLFDGYYIGGLKKGLPNGKGVFVFDYGLLQYEGAFASGMFCGNGKLFRASVSVNPFNSVKLPTGPFKKVLVYDGEWKNNDFHGFGVKYDGFDRPKYEGEWQDGRLPRGKFYQWGKLRYEGEMLNGRAHGEGTDYYYWDGSILRGSFENGRLIDSEPSEKRKCSSPL